MTEIFCQQCGSGPEFYKFCTIPSCNKRRDPIPLDQIHISTRPDEPSGGTDRDRKWDHRFLAVAEMVSTWSKDPSTKCGAVIVRPDLTLCSVGFNGFPRGCHDNVELYENRELKYDRVIHAEENAILAAKEPLKGYTLYSFPSAPGPSCVRCTTSIIQSGITRVVHFYAESFASDRWQTSIRRGLCLYKEAGVSVISYKKEE